MHRATLLLILLCGWLLTPALAQEETPEPVFDFEFFPEDFLSFPQSLALRVGIGLPAEQVAGLALIIQPQGRDPITITFPDPVPYEFAREFVVATYVWEITPETAPPLFGKIRYTWRLTTSSGETHQLSRTVDYTDNRVSWRTVEGDVYLMTLPYNVQGANLTLSEPSLNATASILRRNTGQTLALKWLVFTPGLTPGCRLDTEGKPVVQALNAERIPVDVPCNTALANTVYTQSGYTPISLAEGEALQTRLLREIIRGYYEPLWANTDAPVWFHSAVERLYASPGSQALVTSRQALRSGAPLPLTSMETPVESDPGGIWSAQAYGMMLYIMDKIGVDGLFALTRALAETPFDEAYEAAMNEPLASLIAEWQTWLYTDRAAGAYTYTVFSLPTPSPTPTFTPTNTRTPLPPTETPTPTPDFSPTPRPTRTRIPPTPTITPLPAQSFSIQPTPLPTATPIPLLDQPVPGLDVTKGQFAVIGGGIAALLVVLSIVALLWRRR